MGLTPALMGLVKYLVDKAPLSARVSLARKWGNNTTTHPVDGVRMGHAVV